MNAAQLLRIYKAAIGQMVAQKSLVLVSENVDSAIRAEGLTRNQATVQAREFLSASPENLTEEEVTALLTLAGDLTEEEDGVPILNALLSLRNHQSHEDIVRTLQATADPCSVPALVSTLESEDALAPWDEGKALARKCFWALGAIGTDEAWKAIERYSHSDDPILLQWANEQLERKP